MAADMLRQTGTAGGIQDNVKGLQAAGTKMPYFGILVPLPGSSSESVPNVMVGLGHTIPSVLTFRNCLITISGISIYTSPDDSIQ